MNNKKDLIDGIDSMLPEELSDSGIATLSGFIIAQYATDKDDALRLLRRTGMMLDSFYKSQQGEAREQCSCPKCAAERNKKH